MKTNMLLGLILVILGALTLIYQGISYTRTEKVFEIGPIQATQETQKRIPIPPIIGGVALAGGIVLLILGARQKGRG